MIEELKEEINNISIKFTEINTNLQTQSNNNEKMNQLIEIINQYSKELKNSEEKLQIYNSQVENLNNELANLMLQNQKLLLENGNFANFYDKFVGKLNQHFSLMTQWMENYMGISGIFFQG